MDRSPSPNPSNSDDDVSFGGQSDDNGSDYSYHSDASDEEEEKGSTSQWVTNSTSLTDKIALEGNKEQIIWLKQVEALTKSLDLCNGTFTIDAASSPTKTSSSSSKLNGQLIMEYADENPFVLTFTVLDQNTDLRGRFSWEVPQLSKPAAMGVDIESTTPPTTTTTTTTTTATATATATTTTTATATATTTTTATTNTTTTKSSSSSTTLLFPAVPPRLKFLGPRLPFGKMMELSFFPELQYSHWNVCSDLNQILTKLERICLTSTPVKSGGEIEEEVKLTNVENLLMSLTESSEIYPSSSTGEIVSALPTYGVSNSLSILNFTKSENGNIAMSDEGDSNKKKNPLGGGFKAGIGYSNDSQMRASKAAESVTGKEETAEKVLKELFELEGDIEGSVILDSCIGKYCERRLKNTSITEIEKNAEFFACVFGWGEACYRALVSVTQAAASIEMSSSSSSSSSKIDLQPLQQLMMCRHDELVTHSKLLKVNQKDYEPLDLIKKHINALKREGRKHGNSFDDTIVVLDSYSKSQYTRVLKDRHIFQVESYDRHHYLNEAVGAGGKKKQWTQRIVTEYTDFKNMLPLELAGAIFISWSETQMQLMKALIVPPVGTPYSGGVFEFDIFLPSTYPAESPKVNLMTTGGGSHRFNPNLYNSGKVCLSLLGTWAGEKWNPEESNLSQVLMSIYCLIFVEDPYFNEPGYQNSIGTERGNAASEVYSRDQRYKTVEIAMYNQIQNPPPVFKSVVEDHFRLRKAELVDQIDKWAKLEKNAGRKSKLADQYRALLEGLESYPEDEEDEEDEEKEKEEEEEEMKE